MKNHDLFKLIRPSIYETKDVNHKKNWQDFFKMVEEKVAMENEIINENEIVSEFLKNNVNVLVEKLVKDIYRKKKEKDKVFNEKLSEENWDIIVNPEEKNRPVDENQSIYLKFLRSREKKAAVWRPEEVCTSDKINEMTLSQRGEIVTNMIAKDFCDWLRKIGGLEETTMDEEILKELFQIGLENPAAKSICIEMKERPSVSYHVAENVKIPKRAFHSGLQRQLLWDIKAEKSTKLHAAFGSQLNPSERWQPPSNQTWKRWVDCATIPEEIVTFSSVFEGITNLKSVKEYYEWLMKNPQHKVPDYLHQHSRFIITGDQNMDDINTSHYDPSKLTLG